MPLFERFTLHIRHFDPAHFPYLRFGLTVLLGILSGALFQWLGIPLPWMLGPMCACTLAVLLDAPVAAPAVIRPPMTSVIGVMLGSNFSPDLFSKLWQWLLPLGMQMVLLVLLGCCGVWFYRRVARLDPVTAFYAGMPGGMMEMSMLGEERGGDGQAVILIHSARILMIVAIVPFVVQALEHVQLGPRQATGLSVLAAPASTFAWLIGIAVLGTFIGKWAHLPARALFGPMFLSIALHATGVTDFVVPREVVIGAQVLLGCTIGCRFIGYDKGEILRILALSMGAAVLLLSITFVFCLAVSRYTGIALAQMLLALAPAGIAEMSLVAMALHIDVGFIIVHQLVRILIVASSAGALHSLSGWRETPPPAAPPDTD